MMLMIAIALIAAGVWLLIERIGSSHTIYWSNATSERHRIIRAGRDERGRVAGRLNGGGVEGLIEFIGIFNPYRFIAITSGLRRTVTTGTRTVPRRLKVPSAFTRERVYDGEFNLPQRAYEGTSKLISVSLNPGLWSTMLGAARLLEISEDGNTRFKAIIPEASVSSPAFEVELLAADLTIEGDKKQRKPIGNEKIYFNWGCGFPKQGEYEVGLIVRLINGKTVTDLGKPIKQPVKVIKRFGLPKQMVIVVVGIFTFAGTLIGIIDTGQKLHWW